MARQSILSPILEEQSAKSESAESAKGPVQVASRTKPSRDNKLHIGGYYAPDEPAIIAFQKLGIDLRTTQQEMLLEAVRDFVAKHQAASAFR
jgi:hypothetical protein